MKILNHLAHTFPIRICTCHTHRPSYARKSTLLSQIHPPPHIIPAPTHNYCYSSIHRAHPTLHRTNIILHAHAHPRTYISCRPQINTRPAAFRPRTTHARIHAYRPPYEQYSTHTHTCCSHNTRRPTAPHHPCTARINTAIYLFIDPIRPARPFMCSLPLPRFPFPTRTYAIQMKQMNHNTTQIISRARISHHTSASARPHMLSQTESACSKCASRYNTHACIYIPLHHSDTRPLLIHLSIHPLLNAHHNTHRTNESICSHAHAHAPTYIPISPTN